MEGRCTCGAVRYELRRPPLFVHACHCTWCQRETGSAFVLNALVESSEVALLQGTPEVVDTPSASGAGQRISRCPGCRTALWSNYGANKADVIRFVRVGTLEQPGAVPPDVQIFTSSKVPWLPLPEGARVFEAFYDRNQEWPAESLARRRACLDAAKRG
ncbi:MAG: GFA family protein [Myxococcales bacterium]|nr:GFA family protein [Myxococcales bacterium]